MIFREAKQKDFELLDTKKRPVSVDFCYTLEHEGKVLGIGGIRLIVPTTAWCWISLTDYASGHIIVIYRTIRDWMKKLAKEKGIKRFQAYIEQDSSEAVRLVEHLGFKWESNMVNFLDKKDASMFVRIF